MSQVNVERVIGLLATDEGLRRRFLKNPHSALREMIEKGMDLNACEMGSLMALDTRELMRFARAIDPRLQRIDVGGE
jgi:hypothetical protein